MRVRFLFMMFLAVSLASPRLAVADEPDEGGALDGGTEASLVDAAAEDGSGEDSGADAAPAFVVACDGALCDTLQGRPSCAMTVHSVGTSAPPGGFLGAAAAALAVFVVRRARREARGARCPDRGGRTC